MEEARKDKPGLVLWTDGSKLDQGQAAAAVCWEDKLAAKWRERSIFLWRNKEILDAELWAISEALEIAKKVAKPRNTPVTILSDSQKALRAIVLPFTSQENLFLRSFVYQKTEELQRTGHPITYQWIPGHSGLIGNEKANLSARTRAEKGGKLTERWSSLAYIRRNADEIRSRNLIKWHETETQGREASRRGYNVPRTKEGISLALGSASKNYASRYYQLKVGHGAVETFLVRIGVIETPECWWCGATEQTVEHLYAQCRKWRKQRRKLVRELEKEGVKWQPQVERRWSAKLLGEEKAVAPLLKYLKTTGIGGREGARERELEWERKNDQVGEDLLE